MFAESHQSLVHFWSLRSGLQRIFFMSTRQTWIKHLLGLKGQCVVFRLYSYLFNKWWFWQPSSASKNLRKKYLRPSYTDLSPPWITLSYKLYRNDLRYFQEHDYKLIFIIIAQVECLLQFYIKIAFYPFVEFHRLFINKMVSQKKFHILAENLMCFPVRKT